jgi:hypothetical protein
MSDMLNTVMLAEGVATGRFGSNPAILRGYQVSVFHH